MTPFYAKPKPGTVNAYVQPHCTTALRRKRPIQLTTRNTEQQKIVSGQPRLLGQDSPTWPIATLFHREPPEPLASHEYSQPAFRPHIVPESPNAMELAALLDGPASKRRRIGENGGASTSATQMEANPAPLTLSATDLLHHARIDAALSECINAMNQASMDSAAFATVFMPLKTHCHEWMIVLVSSPVPAMNLLQILFNDAKRWAATFRQCLPDAAQREVDVLQDLPPVVLDCMAQQVCEKDVVFAQILERQRTRIEQDLRAGEHALQPSQPDSVQQVPASPGSPVQAQAAMPNTDRGTDQEKCTGTQSAVELQPSAAGLSRESDALIARRTLDAFVFSGKAQDVQALIGDICTRVSAMITSEEAEEILHAKGILRRLLNTLIVVCKEVQASARRKEVALMLLGRIEKEPDLRLLVVDAWWAEPYLKDWRKLPITLALNDMDAGKENWKKKLGLEPQSLNVNSSNCSDQTLAES